MDSVNYICHLESFRKNEHLNIEVNAGVILNPNLFDEWSIK